MTGMQPIPTEVAEWRVRVASVVHDVFSSFFSSDRSPRTPEPDDRTDETETRAPRGLETSRWAPQSASASAEVSKAGANRSGVRDSRGRGLEDSCWAPKGVMQRTRPGSRKLADSVWASKMDSKNKVEANVGAFSFSFFFLFFVPLI